MHKVVMQLVKFKRDHKNPGDAIGGDAITKI
jgi:hypothetical protein